MASRGKRFETEINRTFSTHPTVAYVHHAPDLLGVSFTVPNPIDFLCYLQGGRGLAVECKATKAKSLPYSRLTSKRDSDEYGRQWRALEQCASAGVATYVLVNTYGWSGRDGQRGRAWAVPFATLVVFRESSERKSWPLALFETCQELRKVGGAWEWDFDRQVEP